MQARSSATWDAILLVGDSTRTPLVTELVAPIEKQTLAAAAGQGAGGGKVVTIDAAPKGADRETADLLERSRRSIDKMHNDDREEAVNLNQRIESATRRHCARLPASCVNLVEGQAG